MKSYIAMILAQPLHPAHPHATSVPPDWTNLAYGPAVAANLSTLSDLIRREVLSLLPPEIYQFYKTTTN
jgi:hypothetical protein